MLVDYRNKIYFAKGIAHILLQCIMGTSITTKEASIVEPLDEIIEAEIKESQWVEDVMELVSRAEEAYLNLNDTYQEDSLKQYTKIRMEIRTLITYGRPK